MKLLELLQNVDKSEKNKDYPDASDICYDFNINDCHIDYEKYSKRLTSYHVSKLLCTDSYVGLSALYLDGNLVGYTYQSARKNPVEVYYISKESAQSIKDFLVSISWGQEDNYSVCDELDSEMGEGFKVNFSSQLLTDRVVYEGVLCQVVKEYHDYKDIDNWRMAVISHPVDREVEVSMSDVTVPWCVEFTDDNV